jgi:hypothetical protein
MKLVLFGACAAIYVNILIFVPRGRCGNWREIYPASEPRHIPSIRITPIFLVRTQKFWQNLLKLLVNMYFSKTSSRPCCRTSKCKPTLPGISCHLSKHSVLNVSAFLQEQGSLIERHMSENLDIFIRPPEKPTEGDGEDEIQAIKDRLYAMDN